MIFTNQELGAILKMATVMANADGHISEEEKTMMAVELLRFGVNENKASVITKEAATLTPVEACIIISKMTNEEKRYVTAYLGAMICADGKIENSEIKAWALISNLCNLPQMTIKEALDIMTNL